MMSDNYGVGLREVLIASEIARNRGSGNVHWVAIAVFHMANHSSAKYANSGHSRLRFIIGGVVPFQ